MKFHVAGQHVGQCNRSKTGHLSSGSGQKLALPQRSIDDRFSPMSGHTDLAVVDAI
jgi:hypothetical protein